MEVIQKINLAYSLRYPAISSTDISQLTV